MPQMNFPIPQKGTRFMPTQSARGGYQPMGPEEQERLRGGVGGAPPVRGMQTGLWTGPRPMPSISQVPTDQTAAPSGVPRGVGGVGPQAGGAFGTSMPQLPPPPSGRFGTAVTGFDPATGAPLGPTGGMANNPAAAGQQNQRAMLMQKLLARMRAQKRPGAVRRGPTGGAITPGPGMTTNQGQGVM